MRAAASGPDAEGGWVDFDLHGIVGIRLLAPTAEDVARVTRQIGPLTAPLGRPPDITVRWVDRLPDPGPLTYGAWGESARAGEEFYLLRGKDGVAARTRFPLQDVGDGIELVCERRAGHVPHLLALINLVALAHDVLPLHASAFTYRGTGVLATGWAKGGKTEVLLAFAARGARYVGDEWVYLTPDGAMHGVPEPIRLWSWHVAQLAELRAGLPRPTRARLRALPALAGGAAALAGRTSGLPASVLRRSAPVLARQAHVQIPPSRLFGADAIALHGVLDRVVLVVSSDSDEVRLEPVDGADVAAQMLPCLEDERGPFLQLYRQFRFLFPERRCPTVEAAPAVEDRLLRARLGQVPAYRLQHPYPVQIDRLAGPLEAVLDAAGTSSAREQERSARQGLPPGGPACLGTASEPHGTGVSDR